MKKIITALALAAALTLSATACDWENDSTPAVEIDFDSPSKHRKAPTYKAPKQSAPKAPSTGRRR
ncbi:hypothetical protein ACFWM7_01355 [Streptomyces sp. NPDC058375]|uniref:hypothetical protein n=1 Tax=Streptomyces sp. NPDC058375 TaxID=3346467 RepID=UPI0036662BEB